MLRDGTCCPPSHSSIVDYLLSFASNPFFRKSARTSRNLHRQVQRSMASCLTPHRAAPATLPRGSGHDKGFTTRGCFGVLHPLRRRTMARRRSLVEPLSMDPASQAPLLRQRKWAVDNLYAPGLRPPLISPSRLFLSLESRRSQTSAEGCVDVMKFLLSVFDHPLSGLLIV